MIRHAQSILLLACGTLIPASPALAVALLGQNDFIIAIDADPPRSKSVYFGGEGASAAVDGLDFTKYGNYGLPPTDLGLIVTPSGGPSVLQSLQLVTANDFPHRDPASWQLFGTNQPILSTDNSDGGAENWTLIAQNNNAGLPLDRLTPGPVQSFANSTPYASYRVIFPTVRDPLALNGMQVADIKLFTTSNGTGDAVTSALDTALAIQRPQADSYYFNNEPPRNAIDLGGSQSGYPANESPANVVDGTLNKYLNFSGPRSGFIVKPNSGPSILQSFTLTTANDATDRDPTSFELYGTNSPIVSGDNSFGTAEPWSLISSGSLALPITRNTLGPVVPVTNSTSYSAYKMIFPTVDGSNLMQIAEASFFPTSDGTGIDILNAGDLVRAIDTDSQGPTATKYFNNGGANSGVIVTPSAGPSVIDSFRISTAGDFDNRDPASWVLFGTNSTIASTDNSQGTGESWTQIAAGTFSAAEVPTDRQTEGSAVSVANTTAYKSYKMVFPTLRGPDVNNGMQISNLQLFGAVVSSLPGDANGDGSVNLLDLDILGANFGLTTGATVAQGDFNGDAAVNLLDLDILGANFGTSGASAAAAPEPTALAALLSLGLVVATRRRV